MDQETVRCRRTDGKKWRCRWAVLPNQQYCERHIHRGRLRSRKPVEDDKTFSQSNSKSTATTSISPAPNPQSATKSNAEIDKNICIKKRSREDVHVPLEFNVSSRSVLQHGNVQHCGTSRNTPNHNPTIPNSERCRRTDGKKWRCSKVVVPGQKYKYCAQHMHRGVKKVNNHQNLNTSLSFSIGASHQKMGDDGNRSNESSSSEDDDGSEANGSTNSSSSEATTISM